MKTLEPITINGEIKKARIVDIYDGSIIYNGNQNTAIFSIADKQNHRDLYSRE